MTFITRYKELRELRYANVVKYLQHNNLGGVDFVTMTTLNSLKHQILRNDIENKRESSINQYFQ